MNFIASRLDENETRKTHSLVRCKWKQRVDKNHFREGVMKHFNIGVFAILGVGR